MKNFYILKTDFSGIWNTQSSSVSIRRRVEGVQPLLFMKQLSVTVLPSAFPFVESICITGESSMYTFNGLTVIINVSMIFRYI